MKKFFLFFMAIAFLTACGNNSSSKKQKKNTIIQKDLTIYEYNWSKEMSYYYKKKIAVYGFIWMDTITDELPKGSYTIYERPNCYQCGEVKVYTEIPLKISEIEDTTIENNSRKGQWRLAKVTASVNNQEVAIIDRFDLAEYSYPDYMNSGYQKIDNEYISASPTDGDRVYVEGYIKTDPLGFRGEYQYLQIDGSGVKKDIVLYIKSGTKPNQAEVLVNNFDQANRNIRDKNGESTEGKKLRLFGIWANYMNPENVDAAGMIYVEMMEAIQ